MKKDEENISNIIDSIYSGLGINIYNFNTKFNNLLGDIKNNLDEINKLKKE